MPQQISVPKAQVGDATLSHKLAKNDQAEKDYSKAKSGNSRYQDRKFLLSDKVKNYGNDSDQIFHVGDKTFIDGVDTEDIAQGEAGDCWFLSSLCSWATYVDAHDKMMLDKVICPDRNSTANEKSNGAYMFNLYQFGEWHKIIVDEQLPLKIFEKKKAHGGFRRGNTFQPEKVEDYWALLLEKAFAKLVGGYMKLEGGFPRCAVTYLCGGITTSDVIDESPQVQRSLKEENVFEYLESIEDNALIVVSNYENDVGVDNGLIAGHAYAVTDFEVVNGEKIVQLRNPWGEGEWLGEWSDDWIKDNKSKFGGLNAEQQEKLGLIDTDGKGDDDLDDDGSFWMAWNDFCEEFEQLTVCHLDDPDDMEKRCIGTFSYDGTDCPSTTDEMANDYLCPEKHIQIKLTITQKGLYKFQLTLDTPMKADKKDPEKDRRIVFLAIHNSDTAPDEEVQQQVADGGVVSQLQLYELDLIQPRLPLNRPENEFKGYRFENYDFNGWVYDMNPGNYILVMGSSPVVDKKSNIAATKYVLRCRGKQGGFDISQLT